MGKTNKSFITESQVENSKIAELNYEIIASIDRYDLLQIEIITGRHHQIRAQFSNLGFPVKGDNKYGFKRGNRDKSIHLHAWKLGFTHPTTGQFEEITAAPHYWGSRLGGLCNFSIGIC